MSDQPMGEGWWVASDGKWYAPELRPGSRHDSRTREIPSTPSTPPPLPPPPTLNLPTAMSTPGGPIGTPIGRAGPSTRLIALALLFTFLIGGCTALVVVSMTNSSRQQEDAARAATPTIATERVPTTTVDSEFSPEPDDPTTTATSIPAPAPSEVPTPEAPTTTLVPPPPTTEPKRQTMPDVICMNLQEAQDLIQSAGVQFSRSFDATDQGRMQLVDRNWIVVSQDPAPGAVVGEFEANLGVVKNDEPNPC